MGGSVEICIHAIARQLAKEHRVTVIGRRHPRLPNKQREGKLTFVRLPAADYADHVVKAVRSGHYDWIQVDNRPKLAARIKRELPFKRVSLFLHSLTFVSRPYVRESEASKLLAKPDLIVANSASLYEALSKRHPHVKSNIRKVLLGVDTERFRPASSGEKRKLRENHGTKGGAFTVLFVGRVIPRKGIPILLRAMRELRKGVPGARVVIAGGGRHGYIAKLKQQARRLGVPAVFTGLIAHRSIHRIYRLADVFVCPSQKHEAFGLVNIEAMASGVPVVASRIGGIGEAVKHERNGYLVDSYKNPKPFARYLELLAKQPELARELSDQARSDAVEKFGWSATAQHLVQLYRHGEGEKTL
jgi:spore coat protein SA